MSFKSKNLAVNQEDPPFLKKLKGAFDEHEERHVRPHGRPVKKLLDEEDDEPTYVDAESNAILTKVEAERMLGNDTGESKVAVDEAAETSANKNTDSTAEEDKIAKLQSVGKIGGLGKRKKGKVVGDETAEDEVDTEEQSAKPAKKKATKKSKAKLSFDEE